MNVLRRLKAMLFGRSSSLRWPSFGTGRMDVSSVGDGTGSSTVMAPILWVARTFPEAPPMLWRKLDNDQEEKEPGHALLRLLERPNRHFTGPLMWMATTTDWLVDGNAYWLKLRDGTGRPAELWWVPHWMIQPVSQSGTDLVDWYEYAPTGASQMVRIATSEVVHFRFGIDGDDPRRGMSPLKSVLREVFTDDEAATFTASLLRNMGVPGLVVSPDGASVPSADDVAYTKEYLKTSHTGDRRGEPLVMSGPTKIAQFGFSPEQLILRELRRIPEERVTAVLGVPAIVAGLGAGLDRSTFTNMAEAREAAYESGIIPMQRILAEDVRFQLLAEFELEQDLPSWRFGFDLTKVRVLQEDLFRQAQRMDLGVRGGWVMVSEARRVMGHEVDPERDDVFLRALNIATVPADGPPPPAPVAPVNGNAGIAPPDIADEVAAALERSRL